MGLTNTENFVSINTISMFNEKQIKKVGSLLHLISKESGGIFLTRLMKLLYVVDKTSVKEIGVPVTDLTYAVAKDGPLAVCVWSDLNNRNVFENYINVSTKKNYFGLFIKHEGEPNYELFSEYELELIERVVKSKKTQKTPDLIDELHEEEDSLWKKIVDSHNIDFTTQKSYISEYNIDLSDYLKENEVMNYMYNSYQITK